MAVAELELTERELEVARLICRGFTNREIGEQLGISRNTVKTHAAHVRQKLNCRNNIQILNSMHMRGLL